MHHKGPYIKDLRKIFGFLDPLPPLVRILARSIRVNPRNLPYYVCFWTNPPSPSLCGRPLCMVPYVLPSLKTVAHAHRLSFADYAARATARLQSAVSFDREADFESKGK